MTGDTNYTFSVAGIAPANDPKYVLYVTVERPKTFGSEGTATKMMATIFNPLLQRTLDDDANDAQVATQTVKDMEGQSTNSAVAALQKAGLKVEVVGSGATVKKQSQEAGAKLIKGDRVILLTNGPATMPNVNGWSQADVVKLSQLLNLKIKVHGFGYVIQQSIEPGTNLKGNMPLEVVLKSH